MTTIVKSKALEISMERRIISGADAQAMLEKNTCNRPYSKGWAYQLAAAMEREEWKENGDTISFDENGNLFDGQHRLEAIRKTNISVPVLIVRNVRRDAFDAKDLGKKRNLADVLSMQGHKNYSSLASCLRVIKLIENGYSSANTFSSVQLEEVLARHPIAIDIVDHYAASKAKKFAFSSFAAVVSVGAGMHGMEKAIKFIDQVATGEGLVAGDPALLLRERLIESAMSQTRKLRERAVAALCTKAWNAFIAQKKMGVLRFNDEETFPIIK